MEKPLFSVVVIARNEEETLPRLCRSLDEFRKRGGQIVVMDTGSTDKTQQVALGFGCELHEATYVRHLTGSVAAAINGTFGKDDRAIVEEGARYFDFSCARNNAADFANQDWVAMPDCDEVYTLLDIDKINEMIKSGVDQFEYNFVYSHNADGTPQLQFRHCKFYNRKKLCWTGVIHEVLTPVGVSPEFLANVKIRREYVDFIKLEHFQNPSTNRGQYLTGLAVDCWQHRTNDRNAHYFARELMYAGYKESAKSAFLRHINMNAWPAERAQSMIHLGDLCDKTDSKLGWWFKAWNLDPGRREALIRIAEFYYQNKQPQQTATFAKAALEIPLNDYYGNQLHHYGFYPHEMLYWAYWNLNKPNDARIHWNLARKYAPTNSKFLHDARFFMELPKVTIVIPHVPFTRHQQLDTLLALIKQNANYPSVEVVVEKDPEPCVGCPKTLNKGALAVKEGLVMFLGDDCEPQPDFLIHAVLSHLHFKWVTQQPTALTALNDGMWDGKLATHWLADRDLTMRLPRGEFFAECYNHVGCDNELTAFAKAHKFFNYCPDAKLLHKPVDDKVSARAWDKNLVAQDRALLVKRLEQYGLSKEDACFS